MIEVFKDVPNYEGIYQVSNFGNVKSLKWNKEIILKQGISSRYLEVKLRKENNSKNVKVHVLVAMAFLNYKPNGKQDFVIDHKNGVRTDNRLENLQIVTQRENVQNYHKSKKGKIGADWHPQTKKWRSEIHINGFNIYLGLFEEKKDALKAYEIANQEIENFENKKQFRKLIKSKI